MNLSEGPRYLTATDTQGLGLTIGRIADVLEEAFRHKAAGHVVSPPMTFFHRETGGWFNSMVCSIAPGCLYISLDRDSYITDEAVSAMDLVFSDDREALVHAREHENAFHAVSRVDADLTQIAAGGAVTRRSAQDKIAVFVNGLGIEDLAAAIEIYRRAQEMQAGTVLPAQFG